MTEVFLKPCFSLNWLCDNQMCSVAFFQKVKVAPVINSMWKYPVSSQTGQGIEAVCRRATEAY